MILKSICNELGYYVLLEVPAPSIAIIVFPSLPGATAEPLIKGTPNKKQISIKGKSTHPNSYYTILTSE